MIDEYIHCSSASIGGNDLELIIFLDKFLSRLQKKFKLNKKLKLNNNKT